MATFHKQEIERLRKDKEKLLTELVELQSKFKNEKNVLIKDYNDRIFHFKEKEKSRIKDIEEILFKLENDNKALRENFDHYVLSQKQKSAVGKERLAFNNDSLSRNNYAAKKMQQELSSSTLGDTQQATSDKKKSKKKLETENSKSLEISLLKEEIQSIEERINRNNQLLKNYEFSKNRPTEENKAAIYSILRQLEEDTEYVLQLKRKGKEIK